MVPTLPADFLADLNGHAIVWGKTGMGKSKLLVSTALAIILRARAGLTLSCPHGTARELAEHLANPANGYSGAVVHYLDCGSSCWTFGLQPFDVDEDNPSPEACHDAAVLWTACVAAVYATAMTATPRLETYLYALGLFAAAKKLTLIELLAAISLSGGAVRDFMLADIDNPAIVGVLTDLNELAKKHPARFLEQLESCRNRLVRWLGDKRLMRIFGKRKGLNARKIMDGREHVLFDPSALMEDDANFLSNILVSGHFAAAKRRPPNASAPHRLLIDEAAGSFSPVTSKFAAQARKYGLYGIWGIQSKAQGDEKSEFITQNLVANAAAHVVFRTPEPDAARYLAETVFNGCIDYQEYKPESFRPVAVGNEKVIVRGRSRATHEAEAESAGISDTHSSAYASASMTASMFSSGMAFGDSDSASFVSTPPDQLIGSPPVISKTVAHNSSRVGSSARGTSSARSSSYQQARSHARTRARSSTSGTSEAVSETEQYITRFEMMGTTMYSLEEQLHRLTSEIMTLPARECFVRVDAKAPVRAITATVKPPFKSIEFRNAMLPRFLESAARRSPYLVPPAQVDAEIAARLQAITTPQHKIETENFSPEPDPAAAHVAERASALRRALQEATPPVQPRPHLRVVSGKDGDSSS